MSSYTSFALIGGGTVGLPIVHALAAKNVSVVVLSRPGSKGPKDVPAGVPVEKVDYTDAQAVADILKKHKVEVVLSTIPTHGASQEPFADAAKIANVRLFVPSEYGLPTAGHTEGILGGKDAFAAYLNKLGIPWTRVYVGMFIEWLPWLVAYPDTVNIVGEGNTPFSATAIEDIAGFVAHVLTTLPPSALENKIFRLQGARLATKDIADILNAKIAYVDEIPGEESAFKTFLHKAIATGAASTGWDVVAQKEQMAEDICAGSGNAFWPGHVWKSIKDVVG